MSWFTFSFADFAVSFLSILFEGIPYLLLGSIVSGLVDIFVSPARLTKILPGNSTPAILLSGVLGLVFPMCECSSVVIIRRFIKKGLPLAPAVTYMLAAPIVSPIVAFSTFAAFRGRDPWMMTGLRLGLGYLITVIIGLIVRQIPPSSLLQPAMVNAATPRGRAGLRVSAAPVEQDFAAMIESSSIPRKLLLAVQSATADFLDVTVLLVIGAALASVFNTAINQAIILPYAVNPLVAILVLMGIAAALAICSTTDAFIAASFTPFPFAAKLAFLLFGPLFNLKLFFLYSMLFKRRWVFSLGLFLLIVIAFVSWRVAALSPNDF